MNSVIIIKKKSISLLDSKTNSIKWTIEESNTILGTYRLDGYVFLYTFNGWTTNYTSLIDLKTGKFHWRDKNLDIVSNCIAIEDTANGNTSALNADLPTVITTHAYTVDNDFTGSSLVLNNLGEPNSDFISSDEFDCKRGYVDIELLNDIMEERYRFFIKKKLDRKINSEYKK